MLGGDTRIVSTFHADLEASKFLQCAKCSGMGSLRVSGMEATESRTGVSP